MLDRAMGLELANANPADLQKVPRLTGCGSSPSPVDHAEVAAKSGVRHSSKLGTGRKGGSCNEYELQVFPVIEVRAALQEALIRE